MSTKGFLRSGQIKGRCFAALGVLSFGMLFLTYTAQAVNVCDVVTPNISSTMQLSSSLPQTVTGATVGFTANVQPPDDTLFLAVSIADAQGVIIDRFVVPTGQENSTVFSWRVPNSLNTGTYTVTAILTPAVVPYASVFYEDTLPRDTASLAVVAERDIVVDVDNMITFNTDTTSGKTTAHISNDTNEPLQGVVEWKVWSVSASANAEPLFERKDTVKLHPHASDAIVLALPYSNLAQGTYYMEARMTGRSASFVTQGWFVDGVFSAMSPCSSGGREGDMAPSSQLMLLSIIGIGGVGVLAWYVTRRIKSNELHG